MVSKYNICITSQDDGVDSRIASSIEWSLEEFTAAVNRIATLVASLQSRLKPKS